MDASTKKAIAYAIVGMLFGVVCTAMYYVPAYDDMIQQRNDMSQELCNVENDRDGLRLQLSKSELELRNIRGEYDMVMSDRDTMRDRLDESLQDAYRHGYDDGYSGASSNDDFIWDLIGILF